ncbi:MAG: L,D-transpeptidase family protein [Clostridia bacterium]|nr:L,D-transpeptidase family protein [Clostridia bacterium]
MFSKRVRLILCTITALVSLYLLYSNILVLDDAHPRSVETMQELNKESDDSVSDPPSADQKPSIDQKPSVDPKPPSEENKPQPKKGYHLHINLDNMTMYVYKNGELLKTYPVSGGKRSTPSPIGTWRIISKDTWGEGFGGAWLGFNVPWGKYGIHGTVYPWLIGKSNSSKGCIRMNNKDVKELYKLVPHGTTVTIIHSNPPFRTMKSGDIGSDVAEVQKALRKLGYYNGSSNGKFGTGLKQSVMKFQKANKIKATGSVGRQTYDVMMGQVKSKEVPSTPSSVTG